MPDLPVRPHPEGVVVEVWVTPSASRPQIGGLRGGALRVRVAAPAEEGKANRAVAEMVARLLGARRGEVVSGFGSRRKEVLVRGVALDEARRSLTAAAAGTSG